MLMTEIDDQLRTDVDNISTTRQLFYGFDPALPEILNDVVILYHTCTRVFSQGSGDPAQPVQDAIEAIGVSTLDELITKLEGPIPAGQEEVFEKGKAALNKVYSF